MAERTKALSTKKKLILSAGIVALIAVGVYAQATTRGDIPKIIGPAIPYDHLSSEKTEPYLISGKAPEKNADIRAALKWPDVQSCLIQSEQKVEMPDVRKINWRKMRKDTDIQVCMFRIFSSLGAPEKVKTWYEAQGFDVHSWKSTNQYVRTTEAVQARKHISNIGDILVPSMGVRKILLSFLAYSETFGAHWDKNGVLINTSHDYLAL